MKRVRCESTTFYNNSEIQSYAGKSFVNRWTFHLMLDQQENANFRQDKGIPLILNAVDCFGVAVNNPVVESFSVEGQKLH